VADGVAVGEGLAVGEWVGEGEGVAGEGVAEAEPVGVGAAEGMIRGALLPEPPHPIRYSVLHMNADFIRSRKICRFNLTHIYFLGAQLGVTAPLGQIPFKRIKPVIPGSRPKGRGWRRGP
jgi:hypothetical protein